MAAKIQLLAPGRSEGSGELWLLMLQCRSGAVGATKQVLLNCLNQSITTNLIDYTAKDSRGIL